MWTTLQRSKLNDEISGWQAGAEPQHMLLIHGVGMNADYWTNLLPQLESNFCLTVIDMPGHGKSPAFIDDVPEVHDYTDCIARVVQQNNAPTVVVGHSMGAMIAIDLAARYSDNVSAIVAMNAIHQRSDDAKAAVRARADNLDDESVSDSSNTLERWFGDERDGLYQQAGDACAQWLSDVNPRGYRQAYRAFAYHDGPDEAALNTIGCPALYITGEDEPNSTPAMSHTLATVTEKGESHIVGGARHMMSMTHAEDVMKSLLAFTQQSKVQS